MWPYIWVFRIKPCFFQYSFLNVEEKRLHQNGSIWVFVFFFLPLRFILAWKWVASLTMLPWRLFFHQWVIWDLFLHSNQIIFFFVFVIESIPFFLQLRLQRILTLQNHCFFFFFGDFCYPKLKLNLRLGVFNRQRKTKRGKTESRRGLFDYIFSTRLKGSLMSHHYFFVQIYTVAQSKVASRKFAFSATSIVLFFFYLSDLDNRKTKRNKKTSAKNKATVMNLKVAKFYFTFLTWQVSTKTTKNLCEVRCFSFHKLSSGHGPKTKEKKCWSYPYLKKKKRQIYNFRSLLVCFLENYDSNSCAISTNKPWKF